MIIEKYSKIHSLDEILFVDKQSIEDFFEDIKDVYSQDDLLDIDKNYTDNGGYMAVGIIVGEIVAMCGYLPGDDNSASLMRLRVRKDLRGRGYGKEILAYIEKIIRKKKFTSIKFSTAASRENTLHFYRKRGYMEINREMYGKIETVIFEKKLLPVG